MTAVALEIRPARPLRPERDRARSSAARTRRPWSRAMFASELAKPTSISLGAFEGDTLVGYAVNSRYVDAWHVMNVAVDPDHQGRGIARQLLERLFEVTADDQRRGYTLEVRVSNATAIHLYEQVGFEQRGIRRGYYTDNREDALIMWRDAKRPHVILGIETSCDETAAALVTRDGEILRRASSPHRTSCTPASAGSFPRSRAAATSSSIARDRARRSPTRRPRRVERSPSRRGPGLIGALLVGVSRREGARLGAAAAARARQPPARPRRLALPEAARPRTAVHLPARERRPHDAARRAASAAPSACSGRRSTTRPARPSTRARGCSASATPAAGRSTRSPRRAIPTALRLPGRARARPRLLVLRAQDGAALRASATSPPPSSSAAAPIWPRATSARSSARSSSGSRRPEATGSPSSAASRPTRSFARPCRTPRSRRSRSAPTTPR